MSENNDKKIWKLWEWRIVTKEGNSIKEDSFNMPYMNTEPNEVDIRVFMKNFMPRRFSQLQSVTRKFIKEYTD